MRGMFPGSYTKVAATGPQNAKHILQMYDQYLILDVSWLSFVFQCSCDES